MSLVDTLTHDRQEIFKLLDESGMLGVVTDEGRRKLKQVRGVVVAHLKREDLNSGRGRRAADVAQLLPHRYEPAPA